MPIFAGSRYEGLKFTPLIEADNSTTKKFIHLRIPPRYSLVTQHELLPEEELDLLAYEYGGQARRWWQIAEANSLFWPLDLPQATRLDMPF